MTDYREPAGSAPDELGKLTDVELALKVVALTELLDDLDLQQTARVLRAFCAVIELPASIDEEAL